MKSKKSRTFSSGLPRILALAIAVTMAAPAAAEQATDPGRIDLLRPGRLLVQITDQDNSNIASDRYRLRTSFMSGQDRGYRNVSRANILNSPAARYFARKLTGVHRN